jgi:hypothetical protein
VCRRTGCLSADAVGPPLGLLPPALLVADSHDGDGTRGVSQRRGWCCRNTTLVKESEPTTNGRAIAEAAARPAARRSARHSNAGGEGGSRPPATARVSVPAGDPQIRLSSLRFLNLALR